MGLFTNRSFNFDIYRQPSRVIYNLFTLFAAINPIYVYNVNYYCSCFPTLRPFLHEEAPVESELNCIDFVGIYCREHCALLQVSNTKKSTPKCVRPESLMNETHRGQIKWNFRLNGKWNFVHKNSKWNKEIINQRMNNG